MLESKELYSEEDLKVAKELLLLKDKNLKILVDAVEILKNEEKENKIIKSIQNNAYKISKVKKHNRYENIYRIKSIHTSSYIYVHENDIEKLEEIIQLLKKTKDMF